jgi:Domain of unknown function (DUF4129)
VLSPRQILLSVLLLLTELIAGFVLILGSSVLDATSFGYAALWPIFLTGLTGLAASLLILQIRPRKPWDRILLLATGLLVAGIPSYFSASDVAPGLVDGLLLGLAFWRGVVVTLEPPGHEEVYDRFGRGFSLFFIGIVFIMGRGLMGDKSIWRPVALAGITYVALFMLALGVAKLEEEREPGALVAVALAIAAQVILLLALSVGALQIFSLDMFGWLGHQIQPATNALGAMLFHIVTPFGALFDSIFNHIKALGSRSRPYVPRLQGHGQANVAPLKRRPKQHPNYAAYGYAALAIFVLILVAVAFAIWRSVPHRSRAAKGEQPYRERREAAITLRELWQAALLFLRRIFRRSAAAAEMSMAALRKRVWGAPYPHDPVRRAYAKLLRRSAAAGMARPPAMTPREFVPPLSRRWQEGADHFEALTDAYTVQRYAAHTLPPEHVDRAETAWQHLRRIMRVSKTNEP